MKNSLFILLFCLFSLNLYSQGYTIISYFKPTTLAYFKKQGFIEKEIITLVEKYLAP